jgi:hypothetical protein
MLLYLVPGPIFDVGCLLDSRYIAKVVFKSSVIFLNRCAQNSNLLGEILSAICKLLYYDWIQCFIVLTNVHLVTNILYVKRLSAILLNNLIIPVHSKYDAVIFCNGSILDILFTYLI